MRRKSPSTIESPKKRMRWAVVSSTASPVPSKGGGNGADVSPSPLERARVRLSPFPLGRAVERLSPSPLERVGVRFLLFQICIYCSIDIVPVNNLCGTFYLSFNNIFHLDKICVYIVWLPSEGLGGGAILV